MPDAAGVRTYVFQLYGLAMSVGLVSERGVRDFHPRIMTGFAGEAGWVKLGFDLALGSRDGSITDPLDVFML